MKVIRKNNVIVPFDEQKIINAVTLSAGRVLIKLYDEDYTKICNRVLEIIDEENFYVEEYDDVVISVSDMHAIVTKALEETGYNSVATSYRDYRNYKEDFVHMLDEVYKKSQTITYIGDVSNANTDSSMISTQRSLVYGELNKALYQKFFMTTEENQACEDGYIYIQDMKDRRDGVNCCLADISNILNDGFEMGNVHYNEPKTLDVAFDVISDIVMSMASQQYGGYTIPRVDTILNKYADMSYKFYYDEFLPIYMEKVEYLTKHRAFYLPFNNKKKEQLIKEAELKTHNKAMKKVRRDFEQGFQSWEYVFNTVGSSRGDYPFIAISFGIDTSRFGLMASEVALETRKNGQGKKGFKKQVLFPKLTFLYDENLHGTGKEYEWLFDKAVECSTESMYPDYLSLTGEGYIPSIYKKYGQVISLMGCVEGNEIITYKHKNKLYVESFWRMWNRLSDYNNIKQQVDGCNDHLYLEVNDVQIYDTKKGFVNVKKVIRNTSTNWMNVKMSHGRSLMCTSDHPFHTNNKGRVLAKDLSEGDLVNINPNQYYEENYLFDSDKAWLLGFMLCDGCYDNHITSSIALDTENDIEEKYKYAMKKCFNLEVETVVRERGKKGNYKDLKARGENIAKAIDYLSSKFEGLSKNRRHIPNEVFEWDYNSKLNFLAGMIDADGYINPKTHGGSIVQLGSVNKELALQQMALAQALDMPVAMYQNHYSKDNPKAIRYRIEFAPTDELLSVIVSQKKVDNYIENITNYRYFESSINETIQVDDAIAYSYDVETDSDHFEVSGIYSHNCRASLSPWYVKGGMNPLDETDYPVFEGRCNLGAISLNLPMILQKSRVENKGFYEVLDYYLEMIRSLHKRTYDYLGEKRASTNPLAWMQGGFLNGNLKANDKIRPLLAPMTMSFGVTALNELQELYNEKSLVEESNFALEVMEYINNKIEQYKKEDNILYASYGTPAETLAGKQVEQFRAKYGVIKKVSDKPYVSNSFHCHVSEKISPIQKQDLEYKFWNLFNGGKIQYCRYPIGYNAQAIKTIVKRAMDMGFYEGVNLDLCYCEDCGHKQVEMTKCPKCGSENLTIIDRMNGYLGYTRVKGDTRYNPSKNAEILDRVSM